MENPQQLIRSWELQGSFSNGAVTQDKLVPREFTRIRTPFIQTWRHEQMTATLNWGSQYHSWYVPDSLRVIGSMFLRIELPAINSGNYKDIPGLYAVDQIRFLTNGTESYFVQVGQFLRDYLESLTDEQADIYARTFLGYRGDGGTAAARVLMIPIMLPNSPYFLRSGRDTQGHGVWPAYLGGAKLEVQFTLPAAGACVKAGADDPASISTNISVCIHQVEMTTEDVAGYSDSRGQYSVMTRRFTELTDGWTNLAANTRGKITQKQPVGNVTELFAIAVPQGTVDVSKEIQSNVKATHFSITSDSVVQKSLNTPEKVEMELWQNGFIGNKFANSPSRLCFSAHASEAENLYSGAYNMYNSSQITIDLEFAENVDYRLFAVQLQRIIINGAGDVIASLT